MPRENLGPRKAQTIRFEPDLHDELEAERLAGGYGSFQDYVVATIVRARAQGIKPEPRAGRLPLAG